MNDHLLKSSQKLESFSQISTYQLVSEYLEAGRDETIKYKCAYVVDRLFLSFLALVSAILFGYFFPSAGKLANSKGISKFATSGLFLISGSWEEVHFVIIFFSESPLFSLKYKV